MGKVTGVCTICGRTSADVYKCGLCGATACSHCFMRDINACKGCLRKGLWVGDRGQE